MCIHTVLDKCFCIWYIYSKYIRYLVIIHEQTWLCPVNWPAIWKTNITNTKSEQKIAENERIKSRVIGKLVIIQSNMYGTFVNFNSMTKTPHFIAFTVWWDIRQLLRSVAQHFTSKQNTKIYSGICWIFMLLGIGPTISSK